MPRRRATRLASRSKPKVPAGDQGNDLSEETRKSKLEALLKDFDMEVESRIAQMERNAKYMCKAIEKAVTMELFKMPIDIKKMTVQEFFSSGGSFNQKALQDYSEQVESLASNLCSGAEISQSETEENIPPTKKGGRAKTRGRAKKQAKTATRKSSRRATSQVSDSEDESAPTTTRRTTRSRRGKTSACETPAAYTGKAGLINAGLNTPMVTPKFDPRLPLTPACMREAKRGETIMSMNGSPINNPARLDAQKPGLILGNGKVIDVEQMKEDAFDGGAMDETTRNNIMMLQDYLGKILQHSTTEASD